MHSQKHRVAHPQREQSFYTRGRSRNNEVQVRDDERQVMDIRTIKKVMTANTLREVQLNKMM